MLTVYCDSLKDFSALFIGEVANRATAIIMEKQPALCNPDLDEETLTEIADELRGLIEHFTIAIFSGPLCKLATKYNTGKFFDEEEVTLLMQNNDGIDDYWNTTGWEGPEVPGLNHIDTEALGDNPKEALEQLDALTIESEVTDAVLEVLEQIDDLELRVSEKLNEALSQLIDFASTDDGIIGLASNRYLDSLDRLSYNHVTPSLFFKAEDFILSDEMEVGTEEFAEFIENRSWDEGRIIFDKFAIEPENADEIPEGSIVRWGDYTEETSNKIGF